MISPPTIFFGALISAIALGWPAGAVDLTLEKDATGTDVVLAVIAKIEVSQIFEDATTESSGE